MSQNSTDSTPTLVTTPGITKFYVAYHDPKVLAACDAPLGAVRVNLNDLDLPTRIDDASLAESRLLLAMSLNPDRYLPTDGYVALFHASYDTKFSLLPRLKELPELLSKHLRPERVFGPIMCSDYDAQADRHHRGMGSSLRRILNYVGIEGPTGRQGPMTNSFVAHTSVWRRFLQDWLRTYVASADERASCYFDRSQCKDGVAQAYLCERFTTAWFAAQPGLQCSVLMSQKGEYYTCLADVGFSDNYPGDIVPPEAVTFNGPAPHNSTPPR